MSTVARSRPRPERPVPDSRVRAGSAALEDAARVAREVLGADHASVLVAHPSGRLVPATDGGGIAAYDVRSAALAPVVVDGVVRGALLVGRAAAGESFDGRLLDAVALPLRALL